MIGMARFSDLRHALRPGTSYLRLVEVARVAAEQFAPGEDVRAALAALGAQPLAALAEGRVEFPEPVPA